MTGSKLGLVGVAALAGALAGCGGSITQATGNGPPEVRQGSYRLYEIPGGRVITCIGFGYAGQKGATLQCDFDHPLRPSDNFGTKTVRRNDYRLYEIPAQKVIVCIGFGSPGDSGAALQCDFNHPLDR